MPVLFSGPLKQPLNVSCYKLAGIPEIGEVCPLPLRARLEIQPPSITATYYTVWQESKKTAGANVFAPADTYALALEVGTVAAPLQSG
jgi:hypothetical protein